MLNTPGKTRAIAITGLVIGILFWSGNSIAGRLSIGLIPPVSFAFWRWAFAFLVLYPFAHHEIKQQRHALWKHRYQLLILAVLSISSFNTLLYIAAQTTFAVNITLIQTSLPISTFIFSAILLHQLPTKRQAIGLMLLFAGLFTILSHGSINNLLMLEGSPGDLYMLVAVIGWGLYSVLLKRFDIPLSGVALLTTLIGIGVIVLSPFYLFEYLRVGGIAITWQNLGLISYVTLFASIAAYLCWNNGVKVIGSNLSSMFNSLMPVFTAILALIILNEPLYSYHFFGGMLIFTGLWLSLFGTEQNKPITKRQHNNA